MERERGERKRGERGERGERGREEQLGFEGTVCLF